MYIPIHFLPNHIFLACKTYQLPLSIIIPLCLNLFLFQFHLSNSSRLLHILNSHLLYSMHCFYNFPSLYYLFFNQLFLPPLSLDVLILNPIAYQTLNLYYNFQIPYYLLMFVLDNSTVLFNVVFDKFSIFEFVIFASTLLSFFSTSVINTPSCAFSILCYALIFKLFTLSLLYHFYYI